MLRIVYTQTEIVTIIENSPSMGTTYTPHNVIVCTEQEALSFFNAYPDNEIQKLINYIESGTNPGTVENVTL